MLPEYFIYKLTGIKVHEYTNSSTTGLLDIKEKRYSHKIIEQLGFDKELFDFCKKNYNFFIFK